jgi:F-type H+-transporting ATPase subunit b
MLALWYFLYGPLTRMLEERRQKVADGVRDAESAKHTLAEIERSRGVILAAAGTEADEVLKKSRAAAQEKERELVAAGEATAANILREAAAQAAELKAEAIAQSKQEVAKLVVLGVEKMLKTK